jgi:predicted nuclease of predicted toxin-antitoxin system
VRFLIDENVHRKLLPFLKKLRHDASLSPKGLTNGEVLRLAIEERRILVTHDTDFQIKEAAVDHPGIMLLKVTSKNLDKLKAAVERFIRERGSTGACEDKLFFISEDGWEEVTVIS